ncbi:MAG: alcohol dehydrogenase, partial [Christensenellaceae bacterium]
MFLDFTFPTKLLIGAGSLSKLKKISLPGRKALVVASAGGSLRRSGAMDKLLSLLGEREVETVLFEKVLP